MTCLGEESKLWVQRGERGRERAVSTPHIASPRPRSFPLGRGAADPVGVPFSFSLQKKGDLPSGGVSSNPLPLDFAHCSLFPWGGCRCLCWGGEVLAMYRWPCSQPHGTWVANNVPGQEGGVLKAPPASHLVLWPSWGELRSRIARAPLNLSLIHI